VSRDDGRVRQGYTSFAQEVIDDAYAH